MALLISLAARRKELTVTYRGSDRLVSVDGEGVQPGVKVEFQGQAIRSLLKMNFAIKNTGSIAIRAEDIKEPLGLVFPDGVQVLNAAVEKTVPDFTFHTSLEASRTALSYDFPLLNPGDEAYVAVYVYNSPPRQPTARGRIVDVRQIGFLDSSAAKQPNPFPYLPSDSVRRVAYWVLLAFNCSLALVFAAMFIKAAAELIQWRDWLKKWADEYEKAVIEKEPDRKPEYEKARREGRGKHPKLFNILAAGDLQAKSIPGHPNNTSFTTGSYIGFALTLLAIDVLLFATTSFLYYSPRGY